MSYGRHVGSHHSRQKLLVSSTSAIPYGLRPKSEIEREHIQNLIEQAEAQERQREARERMGEAL